MERITIGELAQASGLSRATTLRLLAVPLDEVRLILAQPDPASRWAR